MRHLYELTTNPSNYQVIYIQLRLCGLGHRLNAVEIVTPVSMSTNMLQANQA